MKRDWGRAGALTPNLSPVIKCLLWLLQEQKKRELEEMNRVFAELGIETPQAQADKKTETGGESQI